MYYLKNQTIDNPTNLGITFSQMNSFMNESYLPMRLLLDTGLPWSEKIDKDFLEIST